MDDQNQQLSKAERRHLKSERKREKKVTERKRQNRKKIATYLFWIVVVVVVVLGIIFFSTQEGEPTNEQRIQNQGNTHIESADTEHEPYTSYPPTSGPHISNIARWGIHNEEIPDELQIHNLEDGGVIIQYHPDQVTEDEISQLESIVTSSNREHLILAPYTNMDYKIVATAWNRLLDLEVVDEEQINSFVKKYEGKDHHNRAPSL